MFSKIRMVLFRSLLESLGNVGASEEPIPSRRAHFLRSNLMDMVEELKSVENEKGFILVASVPASEVNSALETLQREVNNFVRKLIILSTHVIWSSLLTNENDMNVCIIGIFYFICTIALWRVSILWWRCIWSRHEEFLFYDSWLHFIVVTLRIFTKNVKVYLSKINIHH